MDSDTGRDDCIGTAMVSLARARMHREDKVQAPVLSKKGGHQHGYIQVESKMARERAHSCMYKLQFI